MGYGLLVFCGALTLSPFVLPLILGPAFEPSAHVLQIFAWMFPFAAFNEFVAFYVFVPRKKDRLAGHCRCCVGAGESGRCAYSRASGYGAIGMASARVVGEATLAVMLLSIMIRLELVGLVPARRGARAWFGLHAVRGLGRRCRRKDE